MFRVRVQVWGLRVPGLGEKWHPVARTAVLKRRFMPKLVYRAYSQQNGVGV